MLPTRPAAEALSPAALPLPSVRGRFRNPDPVTARGARGAAAATLLPAPRRQRCCGSAPSLPTASLGARQTPSIGTVTSAWCWSIPLLSVGGRSFFFPSFEQCSQLSVGVSVKTRIPVGFPSEGVQLGPQEPPRGRRQWGWGQLSCTRLCPAGGPCPAVALPPGHGLPGRAADRLACQIHSWSCSEALVGPHRGLGWARRRGQLTLSGP